MIRTVRFKRMQMAEPVATCYLQPLTNECGADPDTATTATLFPRN